MLDYGLEYLQNEARHLNKKLQQTEDTLVAIDYQIEQDLNSLPDRVNAAAQAILDDTRQNNHDYGSIVALIAIGRVFRIFGSVQSGMNTKFHLK